MRTKFYLFLLVSFCLYFSSRGQMLIGTDTLVGNEWIDYSNPYYKFSVQKDGVYRITADELTSAGIDLQSVEGQSFQLYSMGRQVPIYVSTNGHFTSNDYIEFYGHQNRSEMDRYLFARPNTDMLNPLYSMYTDKSYYYLATTGEGTPLRVNTIPNDVVNPPAEQGYYWYTQQNIYSSNLFDPYFQAGDNSAVSYSSYFLGEGFGRGSEPTASLTVSAPDKATTGSDAILHIRLASANYTSHTFPVTWNDQNIGTLTSNNIRILDTSFVIPLAIVLENNSLKILSDNNVSRMVVSNVSLTYPRSVSSSLSQETIINLTEGSPKSYFVLEGLTHGSDAPVIYSTDGNNRLVTSFETHNYVHFTWPAVSAYTQLHIANVESGIQLIPSLELKTFTDLSADNTEYIIISHPDLMETGTESEYAQYRSSAAGGSYRTKVYSILDLYDQFGYGIEKHPQSIRNFVEFIHRHWSDAKMIFIVGRGVEYYRSRINDGTWEPFYFVPTFGRPGSDQLLAATLWDLVARYPISRLAITDRNAIHNYLNKVREYETALQGGQTLEDKEWIKHVIHISAGKEAPEQEAFKEVMRQLGNELAASDFGAKIFSFQKESSEIVEQSQSKQMEALLRQGTSLINYLGHSSPSTFEYNIIDPTQWNNKGRYPVFSAMGCSAGAIHSPVLSLSDRFVLTPDEGAIAFISGSGSQFANSLINWAEPWYDYFGESNYGASLGESVLYGLREVSHFVNPALNVHNPSRYLLEQQTMQGDPALKMYPLPGPDYLLDRRYVHISPDLLTNKLDSFTIDFSILNIGRNLDQDPDYKIELRYPDGTVALSKEGYVLANKFETPVSIRFPLGKEVKPGVYRLWIEVDPADKIEELPDPAAEQNNLLKDEIGVEGISVVVLSNLITAVKPENFAIVNKPPVLIGTSNNVFSKNQNVHIQLDTTALFNSPLRVRDVLTDQASVVKWTPPVTWIENQVYYWRISYDSITPEQGFLWSTHSFLYKSDSPVGWNQSHFYQLSDDALDKMVADSLQQDFDFASTVTNFRLLNKVQHASIGEIPFGYIDNVFYTEFFSKFNVQDVHVFVVAVDPLTGKFIMNPNPGLYGSFNNLSYTIHCFPYRTDVPESRQALINFIDNVVPSGYYVFFYTYQRESRPDYFPQNWADDEATFGKSIFSTIEHYYPGSQVRTLATTGSKPYIVFFQKDVGGIQEIFAVDTTDVIALSYDIKNALTKGTFTSVKVGPARQWHSIHWSLEGATPDTTGKEIFKAWALSEDYQDTLWISHNLIHPDTVISDIDASEYPYIQLSFTTEDSLNYKPTRLNYWRVLYDDYPEFVLDVAAGFTFIADTLFQGQEMSLSASVENLSDVDIQNLPVSMRILGPDNTSIELSDTIPSLPKNGSAPFFFKQNTRGFDGDYQIITEINAGQSVDELNYANNLGVLALNVIGDRDNPVLDVTFDGYHILDGALVGARPEIVATLHDENSYLRLNDTSSFEIYLTYPSDLQPRRMYFVTGDVQFIAAPGSGKNEAAVKLTPYLNEDGIYALQVKANDLSGNAAGDNDYFITFQVINDPSISYLRNFPNPFRDGTQFIYTLTGPSAPAFYKIEIVNMAGILVREISKEELGPLAPGNHPTTYSWNGTDNNGNPLSAGIYLYRIVAKDSNDHDYRHYEFGGDGGREWGKMVLVR